MIAQLRQGIRDLFPGYFALVMATGIVSLAAHFLGMEAIGSGLFWLNNALYGILWTLTLARMILAPAAFRADLLAHQTGPAFLTSVAATCVLGTQYQVLAGNSTVATVLWFIGLVLWLALLYAFLTSVTVREEKPTLEMGLNGAWLLAVVSTQSLSVLGTSVADVFNRPEIMLFFTLCLYLVGCMLYLLIITLIVYRFTFFKMAPRDLGPPYWINMGAVAITTMAGARLLLADADFSMLAELRPFLKGFTLFFWATATWWIPLLVILGDWRHIVRRVPFTYHPAYWSMVFPLGMYTASTFQLARALDLDFLYVIPEYFIYVALGAWVIVFAAMVIHVGASLRATDKKQLGEGMEANARREK